MKHMLKRFRVSLLALLLSTLAVGALLALNMRPRTLYPHEHFFEIGDFLSSSLVETQYGFPFTAVVALDGMTQDGLRHYVLWKPLAANIFVTLILLIVLVKVAHRFQKSREPGLP